MILISDWLFRPGASKESVKRAREYKDMKIGAHPALRTDHSSVDEVKTDFLDQLKSFKPKSTIFEIGNTSKNKEKIDIMIEKRKKHSNVIEQNTLKQEMNALKDVDDDDISEEVKENVENIEGVTEEDIAKTFDKIVKEGKNRSKVKRKEKLREKKRGKDESNYIPYQPKDHHSESGYNMQSGFTAQAHGAVLDLTGKY